MVATSKPAPLDCREQLKDALLAAAVAAALAVPLIGFHAVDEPTGILIETRFDWVLIGCVAFYAVGAYSYALLAIHFDLSFWICLPLAGLFAGLTGVLLGFPVLRLRGDYLAIVTLGFGEIVRIIIVNWQTLTGGPNGIT